MMSRLYGWIFREGQDDLSMLCGAPCQCGNGLKLGHMPVKPGRVNTSESGKLRYAQGWSNPTIPRQAAELDPGY